MTENTTDAKQVCHLCGGTMEEGFCMDAEPGGATNMRWIPGPVHTSFLDGVKVDNQVPVLAQRCTGCFHLELFAIPEKKD